LISFKFSRLISISFLRMGLFSPWEDAFNFNLKSFSEELAEWAFLIKNEKHFPRKNLMFILQGANSKYLTAGIKWLEKIQLFLTFLLNLNKKSGDEIKNRHTAEGWSNFRNWFGLNSVTYERKFLIQFTYNEIIHF